jgi:hypothetical protein
VIAKNTWLQAARSLGGVAGGVLIAGLLVWWLHDAWYGWEGRKWGLVPAPVGVLVWTLAGPFVGGCVAGLVAGTRGALHGFLVGSVFLAVLLGARDSTGPGTDRALFRPTAVRGGDWYENEHLVLALGGLLVPPFGGYMGERLLRRSGRRAR